MFFINCEINLISISYSKFYFLISNLILTNPSFQEVNRLLFCHLKTMQLEQGTQDIFFRL